MAEPVTSMFQVLNLTSPPASQNNKIHISLNSLCIIKSSVSLKFSRLGKCFAGLPLIPFLLQGHRDLISNNRKLEPSRGL